MSVGQETVNTDVEIHWDHTSATAMKDIHCKGINAKVSLLKIRLTICMQRHVRADRQSSNQSIALHMWNFGDMTNTWLPLQCTVYICLTNFLSLSTQCQRPILVLQLRAIHLVISTL